MDFRTINVPLELRIFGHFTVRWRTIQGSGIIPRGIAEKRDDRERKLLYNIPDLFERRTALEPGLGGWRAAFRPEL
jgi:hypothetical protein